MREPLSGEYAIRYLDMASGASAAGQAEPVATGESGNSFDSIFDDLWDSFDGYGSAADAAEMELAAEKAREDLEDHLARLRGDAVRCARKLAALRNGPPPRGLLLPAEEETRWMAPEERDLAEWFDRREYAVFLRLSELYAGTGWVVPYCRYCCIRSKLGFDCDSRFLPRAKIDHVLDLISTDADRGIGRALNALGVLYEQGFYTKGDKATDIAFIHDAVKARDFYGKSARAGCVQGLQNLARVMKAGIGGAVDKAGALSINRALAERGSGQDCFAVACFFLEGDAGPSSEGDGASRWMKLAAEAGEPRAAGLLAASGGDASPERLLAEYLILCGMENARRLRRCQEMDCSVSFSVTVPREPDVEKDGGRRARDRKWLADRQPAGAVVPAAAGREEARIPNLTSANPSFAARLVLFVRDRFGCDAPRIYKAARLSRKTYSAIVGNELRPVSKQTAVALALALHLDFPEASAFIGSAGYAFSSFLLDDIVVASCIRAGIHDIGRVNEILAAHGAKTFPEAENQDAT